MKKPDWLEDDDWDVPPPTPPTRGEVMASFAVVGTQVAVLVVAAVFLPSSLVAAWGLVVGLGVVLFWLRLRRPATLHRLAVRINAVRKGEYKGQWWLGPEAERRLHERRRRILAERRTAEGKSGKRETRR